MIRKWYERAMLIAEAVFSNLLPLRAGLTAAVLVPSLALPVLAQGERFLGARPFGPWPWVFGLVVLLRAFLVVALVIIAWKILAPRLASPRPDPAVQVLRERYARGEISEDEYRKRLTTLT